MPVVWGRTGSGLSHFNLPELLRDPSQTHGDPIATDEGFPFDWEAMIVCAWSASEAFGVTNPSMEPPGAGYRHPIILCRE